MCKRNSNHRFNKSIIIYHKKIKIHSYECVVCRWQTTKQFGKAKLHEKTKLQEIFIIIPTPWGQKTSVAS